MPRRCSDELALQDGDMALRLRLALYARPRSLVIDEIRLAFLIPTAMPDPCFRLSIVANSINDYYYHQPAL
jgi:hypothetical protein